MWASDYTVSRSRQNWAESLFYLRHSPVLSQSEKEWILAERRASCCAGRRPRLLLSPAAMHPIGLRPKVTA